MKANINLNKKIFTVMGLKNTSLTDCTDGDITSLTAQTENGNNEKIRSGFCLHNGRTNWFFFK